MIKEESVNQVEQLTQKNLELENQIAILMDLNNLKDETFYRRQTLMMLERIAIAIETLKNFSEEDNPKKE